MQVNKNNAGSKILIVEDQFVEANDLQLMLKKAGYDVCGIARSVPIALEILEKTKPDLVLLDIFLKGKLTGIDLAKKLKEENIAFVYLSANSNETILSEAKTTEPYGFIVKPFREKDLLITLEIAHYRHEHSQESRHRREAQLILQLEKLRGDPDPNEMLLRTALVLQQEIPFNYLVIAHVENEKPTVITSFLRVAYNEYQTIRENELKTIAGVSLSDLIRGIMYGKVDIKTEIFINEQFKEIKLSSTVVRRICDKFDLNSLLIFPGISDRSSRFTFLFFSRKSDTYTAQHVSILDHLRPTICSIAPGWPALESKILKPAIKGVNSPDTPIGFNGIIGNSHLLLNVLDQVKQVSPFDTAVLILGESGTGKEGIADCIHGLSPRKNKKFVKINCAALPSTLIESELFGHEKGSFTGAMDKKIGKFELANGGTIFLDEIGEMPVDMQVKLLRVLQQKEIELVGGRAPVKIDVRIIAATNKNLEKEIGEGRFRLDLYYRLNVFPIQLPALRDRIEDIPALAQHFISFYSKKSGKKVSGISEKALKNMMNYNWPGNIRELENLIERSVVLAKGNTIEDITFPDNHRQLSTTNRFIEKTIHENERDYIIDILKKCNGKIWGKGGAAEILKVPPSTLKSKMKKFGIQKGII